MADEVLPISALSFDPANPRLRTERSAHVIRSSLQRYGPLRSLVGQKLPDGRIVIRAGNGTLEEAGQVGIEKVRLIQRRADELVVVVADDLDEEKWVQYSVDDNRASDLSTWDPAILEQISQDFDLSNSFLEGELDELIESLAGLTEGLGEDELFEGETDPDDVPDFDEVETRVKKGDIWRLGRHRVMCGDSTVITDVERLMDGKKADMVFTDPPYLMDFTGGIHADGSKSFNAKHGKIKNDKMSQSDGDSFLDGVNTSIRLFCKGAFYITFYRLGIERYYASLRRCGIQVRSLIIWDKGNHTLSNSDYMSMYEPIFYGWIDEHLFYGGKNGRDIWDIPRTKKNDLHPTMKPVELIEKAIGDGSEMAGRVLDLFLGSGSTLIAAEKTGRTCYGMELSEKYCDVILKRWEDFTGQTAERI